MVWKFPSKTYIKNGCTSEALKDLLDKNIKSVVIVFSEGLFLAATRVKKLLMDTYKNKEVKVQMVRNDENLPHFDCAILVTASTHALDVKYRLHDDIKLIVNIVTPRFNASSLFIKDNEKEIFICDLNIFEAKSYLDSLIKTSAADVFLTSFFYFIKELISKKTSHDLSFMLHIEALGMTGRHLDSEKLEPFFYNSVIMAMELNQARDCETTPHEMLDVFKAFGSWDPKKLNPSKEDVSNKVKEIVIVENFTKQNLKKLSNSLVSLTKWVFNV